MRKDTTSRTSSKARPQGLHSTTQHRSVAGRTTSAGDDGSTDLLRILGRTLRGRYWLTFALSLLIGGIGAAVGWFWAGPQYHSEGMVRIASALPAVLEPTDQNQPIPMFESFMQAQQELLTSRSLLEAALRDPMWDAKGIGNRRPTVPAMAVNLKVEVRPKSENLRISYDDRVAAVASTAVGSIIAAYENAFDRDNQQLNIERLRLLRDYRDALTSQLNAAANPPNAGKSEPAPAEIPPPSEFEMPSPAKVAMVDSIMGRLIDRRNDAKDQLDQASVEFGPNHPSVIRLTRSYDVACQRVDQYLEDYVSRHAGSENGLANPSIISAGNVATLSPATSTQQKMEELDRVNRRIELLKTEASMPKRFEVVDAGDLPVHVPGRQIKWTMAGGGIGCGLAMGIMVLFGKSHRRYRMCADVIETLGKRLQFVTAVPDLSAGSKSRYFEDAAQSMHYFRNKLEQNGAVYMVTSADWGEGRTSVAMSLAISLCGSGARTLIIDADLATRGLTRALKMEERPGFVEMIRNGEVVSPVNMPSNGIAILPAGAATEADGLSISAPALARILEAAKEQFDVVLIDTGPAQGRIEASVMARKVDGILLTICRGQEQSTWDQTLDELESVGEIYGAVFNRAEPKDFDHSFRRRPGGSANPQTRPVAGLIANFGPLVRAVALSLTQEIELYPISGSAGSPARKVA